MPRLLVNRERAGELTDSMRALGYNKGFNFGDGNYRQAQLPWSAAAAALDTRRIAAPAVAAQSLCEKMSAADVALT